MRAISYAFLVLLSLLGFNTGVAQEPQDPLRCPPGRLTVDSIVHRVELVATGETTLGYRDRATAVQRTILVPFNDRPCPHLASGIDRGQALLNLIRRAMDHDNEEVAAPLMRLASAVGARSEVAEQLPDLLLEAVREGRTLGVRWHAALRLIHMADDGLPEGLMEMIRAPSGPPGWPELPADLLEFLPLMQGEGPRRVEAAIRGGPDQLQNPAARWLIVCGRGHAAPLPESDPCHPRNAPPGRQGPR